MQNNSEKVSKKQLSHILGVSYKTALKEHKIILVSLGLTRSYLTYHDLFKYGI